MSAAQLEQEMQALTGLFTPQQAYQPAPLPQDQQASEADILFNEWYERDELLSAGPQQPADLPTPQPQVIQPQVIQPRMLNESLCTGSYRTANVPTSQLQPMSPFQMPHAGLSQAAANICPSAPQSYLPTEMDQSLFGVPQQMMDMPIALPRSFQPPLQYQSSRTTLRHPPTAPSPVPQNLSLTPSAETLYGSPRQPANGLSLVRQSFQPTPASRTHVASPRQPPSGLTQMHGTFSHAPIYQAVSTSSFPPSTRPTTVHQSLKRAPPNQTVCPSPRQPISFRTPHLQQKPATPMSVATPPMHQTITSFPYHPPSGPSSIPQDRHSTPTNRMTYASPCLQAVSRPSHSRPNTPVPPSVASSTAAKAQSARQVAALYQMMRNACSDSSAQVRQPIPHPQRPAPPAVAPQHPTTSPSAKEFAALNGTLLLGHRQQRDIHTPVSQPRKRRASKVVTPPSSARKRSKKQATALQELNETLFAGLGQVLQTTHAAPVARATQPLTPPTAPPPAQLLQTPPPTIEQVEPLLSFTTPRAEAQPRSVVEPSQNDLIVDTILNDFPTTIIAERPPTPPLCLANLEYYLKRDIQSMDEETIRKHQERTGGCWVQGPMTIMQNSDAALAYEKWKMKRWGSAYGQTPDMWSPAPILQLAQVRWGWTKWFAKLVRKAQEKQKAEEEEKKRREEESKKKEEEERKKAEVEAVVVLEA